MSRARGCRSQSKGAEEHGGGRQGSRKRILRFREEVLQKFIASREQRAGR